MTSLIFGLDPRATMERFIWPKDIGPRLRLERSRYVKSPNEATLFVLAPDGFGKSHLLQAIAWDECHRDDSAEVIYLSAAVWNRKLAKRGVGDLLGVLCRADVLLLDDVAKMVNPAWIAEVVRYRSRRSLRTVVSARDRKDVMRSGLGAFFDPMWTISFERLTPSQIRRLIAQTASDVGVHLSSREGRRLASYRYRDVYDVMDMVGAKPDHQIQSHA